MIGRIYSLVDIIYRKIFRFVVEFKRIEREIFKKKEKLKFYVR